MKSPTFDFSGGPRVTLRRRILVSLAIGVVGALIVAEQYGTTLNFHTDFGVSWFGAKSMLHGIDPYPLVGRGLTYDYRWPLVYPGTALVVLIPFALLAEKTAAILFVGLSTSLLAFGLTRKSWHLLPLFATEAFMNSARLGQWSIVLTAALFFPWLAALSSAKPQASLPILAASRSRSTFIAAALGSIVLLLVSLILLPGWISEWYRLAAGLKNVNPPITRFGGFLILLVLVRYRRPESWLILALACLPQTPAWYGTLPLFTIPGAFVEAVMLAGVATLGGYIGAFVAPIPHSAAELAAYIGGLQVLTIYLPAVALVLRRPNEGELSAWRRLPAFTRRIDGVRTMP